MASREIEVDFLLRKGTRLAAIEVESGAHFQESWGKGLRALGNLPGLCRRVVVMPTAPRMVTADRIEVVGFADFENWLATNQFWA